METTQDHREYAEDCVMMALTSEHDSDKTLWLILARSWVRLAEQAACIEGRGDLSGAEISTATLPSAA